MSENPTPDTETHPSLTSDAGDPRPVAGVRALSKALVPVD